MPGANIFLDRVSLKKKKKVYLKKKSQKQEFFMTGKHENYVNRNYFMLGWQPGTRECQQKFSEGWKCHWITIQGPLPH